MPLAEIGVKELHFKLTVVTPVHIGSGETLNPWELAKANQVENQYWLVDLDRWLGEYQGEGLFLPGQREINQALSNRLLAGQTTPPAEVCRGVVFAPTAQGPHNGLPNALGRGLVRATQRELDGGLRIPGSSLKGVIATAWARKRLKAWRQENPNVDGTQRDPAQAWQTYQIAGLGSFDTNPLSCIRVPDLVLPECPSHLLEAHRAYASGLFNSGDTGNARRNYPVNRGWVEAIAPGATVTFSIQVLERTWQRRQRESGLHGWGEAGRSPSEQILEALQEYGQFMSNATANAVGNIQGSNLPAFPKEGIRLPLGGKTHNFTKTVLPNRVSGWGENVLNRADGANAQAAKADPWSVGRHTLVLVRRSPVKLPIPFPNVDTPTAFPLGWISLEPLPG